MRSHREYFERELRELPIEKLWEIIEGLLIPSHAIPDKAMNYEQVLELCIMLKEAGELFGNLEQVAILKNGLDNA